jgi:pimeloyl-ACP methyl ester carboxylesterase
MRAILDEKAELRARGREGDVSARRAALAPAFVTVHRTDADPRTVDLSIDPSKRDYGSIFGRRPDVTNFGAVGFGRLTTPDAWLSTWSGLSSRAALRLTAPEIEVPTLIVNYTADNSVFPSDVTAIEAALATEDRSRVDVDADHYGFAAGTETRVAAAAETISEWLSTQA